MVSKRNQRLLHEKYADKRQFHYGLRKLTVGVSSVLLGTTVLFGTQAVHADTVITGSNAGQPVAVQTDKPVAVENEQQGQTSSALSVAMGNTTNVSSVASSNTAQTSSQAVSQASLVSDGVSSQASSQGSSAGVQSESTDNIKQAVRNVSLAMVNLNANSLALAQNKVQVRAASAMTNGGFDQSKWGTLDVSKW